VHFIRNALAFANKGQRRAVLAVINTIFVQDSPELASAQWRLVSDQLREKFPKLAAMMDAAEQDVLAFMGFPRVHRLQIHSTNPLERLNAEVKRRTNVVGIFPDFHPQECAHAGRTIRKTGTCPGFLRLH
jgi:putative transposase